MSRAIITESKLTAIADAIRSRFGVSGSMTVDEMAETISSKLPAGFQQVEYIQGTGTQYINTEYVGCDGLYIDYQRTSTSNNEALFGAYVNDTTGRYDIYCWEGAYFSTGSSSQGTGTQKGLGNDTNRHILEHNSVDNKIILDDVEIGTTKAFSPSDKQAYIFYRNAGGDKAKMKLYRLKMYTGATLGRDYIPCYRKKDNVIGLYDLVTGVFYTNNGTGTFTKGADV